MCVCVYMYVCMYVYIQNGLHSQVYPSGCGLNKLSVSSQLGREAFVYGQGDGKWRKTYFCKVFC